MKKETPTQSFQGQFILVSVDHVGRRIDNFLFNHFKGVPKSLIYRLLRKRAIRVNQRRVNADYRLQLDDQIRTPVIQAPATKSPYHLKVDEAGLVALRESICFENDQLLILDKPSGLAVHGGTGIQGGLIERLKLARPDLPFLALAHRLDRDTSGCLLLAKTPPVLRELHQLLREGKIKKSYQALTLGNWPKHLREVALPLKRDQLQSGERMVKVVASGKVAISRFQILKQWDQATLLEIALLTGRTHQIRVHTSHMGHPIAGDTKYGDRDFNRQLRQQGLKRMFLHAVALTFDLPSVGEHIQVHTPLPKSLKVCLAELGIPHRD